MCNFPTTLHPKTIPHDGAGCVPVLVGELCPEWHMGAHELPIPRIFPLAAIGNMPSWMAFLVCFSRLLRRVYSSRTQTFRFRSHLALRPFPSCVQDWLKGKLDPT